jgi:hypothetical protein
MFARRLSGRRWQTRPVIPISDPTDPRLDGYRGLRGKESGEVLWAEGITVVERLLDSGRVVQDTQLHLCLPTYKAETSQGGGWAVEKGMAPRPLGAWWIRIGYDPHEKRLTLTESRAA